MKAFLGAFVLVVMLLVVGSAVSGVTTSRPRPIYPAAAAGQPPMGE